MRQWSLTELNAWPVLSLWVRTAPDKLEHFSTKWMANTFFPLLVSLESGILSVNIKEWKSA